MIAAQFLNIASDSAIPLETIVPVGDGVDDYCVEVQLLDEYGYTAAGYTWIGGTWCDDDEEPVSGVTIPVGGGLWVFDYTGGDCSLQSSGKVGISDVVIELSTAGGVAVGNPFPMPLSIDSLVPVGDGVDDYCAEIQVLDEYGYTEVGYTWIGDTWCDDDEEPVSSVSFEAGAGLWAFGYTDDCSLQFAAPEL